MIFWNSFKVLKHNDFMCFPHVPHQSFDSEKETCFRLVQLKHTFIAAFHFHTVIIKLLYKCSGKYTVVFTDQFSFSCCRKRHFYEYHHAICTWWAQRGHPYVVAWRAPSQGLNEFGRRIFFQRIGQLDS